MIESVETEPMVIVYKATNLVNNHFYLGYSARGLAQREEKHRAMARQGRGHHFHAAMRKYGAENFVFEVVQDFQDDEDLAKMFEREAILGWKPQYNISHGGDGHHVSMESRKKIGDANRGRPKSAETLEKMRVARIGKKATEETKAKMRATWAAKYGPRKPRVYTPRVFTPEQRAYMSAINTGKTHSEETRAKIRAARALQVITDETRAKQSAALKGRPAHNKGVTPSAETRAKMRATHLARPPVTDEARANMRVAQAKNRKPVQCVNDGRVFESSREAEIFYGLCQAAVTRVVTGRIKSARGLVFIRWEPK